MAHDPINHGTTAGDGLGETLFNAFTKVNANDAELFGAKTVFAVNYAALPVTGEVGKIYVTLDDDAMYRWTGTVYDDLGGIQFVANAAALPAVGEGLKIYIALDTGRLYFWAGAAYFDLGGLQFDANGNVTANINLRTDTLANLLALTSGGGISEIGYDPITRALVMFNGVPGEAKPSGRELVVARLICGISSTTANADNVTPTAIPFNSGAGQYNGDGLVLVSGDAELVIPVGYGITAARVVGHLNFAAGAGISRRIRIEGWNGTTWTSTGMPTCLFDNPTSTAVNASNTPQIVRALLDVTVRFDTQPIAFTKLRLVVIADAAVAVTSPSAAVQLRIELLAL